MTPDMTPESAYDELEAMRAIVRAVEDSSEPDELRTGVRNALNGLSPSAHDRVVEWSTDRYPFLVEQIAQIEAEAEGSGAGQ